MKWYFERGNGQEGPVTEDEIKSMIASGGLGPENKVWCKDLPDWTVVALLPALQAPPPLRVAVGLYIDPRQIGPVGR